MKKILAIFLVLALVLLFAACGGNGEKFEWSDIQFSTMLPEPESDRANIYSNSNDDLSMDIFKTTEKQYADYKESCVELGFTIDSEERDSTYVAYNQEGYKLDLYYIDSSEKLMISLDAPMEMCEIQWPSSEIAKLLPIPKSSVGKIVRDKSDEFTVYIGNTPASDYNEYVQACSNAGFNVDYDKGDDYYNAENESGYKLSLDYKGYNIMAIRIDEPDMDEDNSDESDDDATVADNKDVTDADEETNETKEVSEGDSDTELVDGMRPEFKEAMDNYEAFFVKYVAFIKEYTESEDAQEMLSDYTDWMTKYADTMEALDVLEDGLEGEELNYYIEVMSRISEKLLEAAEYMGE